MMPRLHYTIDTDDKRLIDDARVLVAGGSLRALARQLGKSEASLRHVLYGRTAELDAPTRVMLRHYITREIARDVLVETGVGQWEQGNRIHRVVDHLLTCTSCLTNAIIASERHFRDTVARNPSRA